MNSERPPRSWRPQLDPAALPDQAVIDAGEVNADIMHALICAIESNDFLWLEQLRVLVPSFVLDEVIAKARMHFYQHRTSDSGPE